LGWLRTESIVTTGSQSGSQTQSDPLFSSLDGPNLLNKVEARADISDVLVPTLLTEPVSKVPDGGYP
jgi:hypothetical protein